MKICSQCRIEKAETEFYNRRAGRVGYYSECKDCTNRRTKKWTKGNPDKVRKSQKKWSLKTKYGLSWSDYQTRFDNQRGLCAICFDPLKGGRNAICVDHDHETGKVRDLLCSPCNAGLGQFRDSSTRMLSAVFYLDRHKNKG